MHESEKWKWSRGRVWRLLATPWTAAYQPPPSRGFFRQEYWSGVPLPSLLFPLNHRLICPCKKCDLEVLCIWPSTSIWKQMHFRELKKKKKNLEYLLEEVLIKGRWREAGSQNQAKYIPHGKLPTKGNNWRSKHIFISLRHRSNSTVFSSH